MAYTVGMTKTEAPRITCRRCHAILRSAKSITRGIGARCLRLERQEQALASDAYKPEQIAAAIEAIEDGAVIPLRGRIFLVVSTNGQDIHRTTATACSCPAGIKGRRCFHRAAVILAA